MKKISLIFIMFSILTFGQNYTIEKNFDGSISLTDDKNPMKTFTMVQNGDDLYITNDLNVLNSYTLTRLSNGDYSFTNDNNILNSYTISKNSYGTYSTSNDYDIFDSYTTIKNPDGTVTTTNDFNVFDSSTMRYSFNGTAKISSDFPKYNGGGAYQNNNSGAYVNPSYNSGGAYQNPTAAIVDYGAFNKGFQQGMNNYALYSQLEAIEAEKKRRWDNKVNLSPEFDFTKGSYKKFKFKKSKKKYEIEFFKPPYWGFITRGSKYSKVKYFDALLGRQYSDGRDLKFWITIKNKLGGLPPSFYIDKEIKTFEKIEGFKRYIEMNLFELPTKSIVLINENVNKYGNKILVGKCMNSVNNMFLTVRFQIQSTSIVSNIEHEFQRLLKVINYTLNNIKFIKY